MLLFKNSILRLFSISMVVASITLLTSCGGDDDNGGEGDMPEPTPGLTASIEGVWKLYSGDGCDYMEFAGGNKMKSYEFGTEKANGVVTKRFAYAHQGYYTFDVEHQLMIVHWSRRSPKADAELWKVETLDDNTLSFVWVEDVDDMVSSTYSKEEDLRICRKCAETTYTIDPNYRWRFTRSSTRELNRALDELDEVRDSY